MAKTLNGTPLHPQTLWLEEHESFGLIHDEKNTLDGYTTIWQQVVAQDDAGREGVNGRPMTLFWGRLDSGKLNGFLTDQEKTNLLAVLSAAVPAGDGSPQEITVDWDGTGMRYKVAYTGTHTFARLKWDCGRGLLWTGQVRFTVLSEETIPAGP